MLRNPFAPGSPRRAYAENSQEIRPLTLAGMRAMGIRSLDAYCRAPGCGHEATLSSFGKPSALNVTDVALRLRCSMCSRRQIETRPDWSQRRAAGMGRSDYA